jgi:hypothetical protein
MRQTADRIRSMIHRRAIAEYCAAFGHKPNADSHLDMCVIHNSLVSADDGKPWREVNYKHMRRAAWLCEQSFEPSRIVTAWYERKSREG